MSSNALFQTYRKSPPRSTIWLLISPFHIQRSPREMHDIDLKYPFTSHTSKPSSLPYPERFFWVYFCSFRNFYFIKSYLVFPQWTILHHLCSRRSHPSWNNLFHQCRWHWRHSFNSRARITSSDTHQLYRRLTDEMFNKC